MIGRIVGNYKIIQALGEGGVGMVYQGVDTMLDREVAIKVLRPELARQNSVVERFRSEAVTLAKLNHPNIATLYSLFRQGDDLFMVMEFINGETLDQLLYHRGAIPTDEAIPIFCQALEGINYAHEHGIVHRDIKPGNMMLTDSGTLKVLDFGIARLLGSNRMTRVGNVIGTLEYMAPEQVLGLETDARSDVYGLGIMLYEMLTGKLPFESENDFELMKMQTEQRPQSPRLYNSDIPVEVEAAIMKAVAKDPNERFQSAGEFLETLLELGFSLPNSTFGFGTMYGFKKNSRPSKPGLSSGETKQTSSESKIPEFQIILEPNAFIPMPKVLTVSKTSSLTPNSEIKGTRLAGSIVTNPNEIKSTKLGMMSVSENAPVELKKSQSFFAGMSWVHYASAGTMIFFLFSLMAAAVVLPSMWTDVKDEPQNVKQKTIEPKNTTVTTPTPISQPVVKDEPAPQPTNFEKEEQVSQPTPNPVMTPIPNNPQPVQNQPKERETVKNNPSAPTQQPKKNELAPKQTKKTKKNNGDLQNILTGKDN